MLKDPRVAAAAGIAALALVVVVAIALAPWSSGNSGAESLQQGDANCDQVVDALDALAVLHVAANVPPLPDCAQQTADVDCSNSINAVDAIEIMGYAAGIPSRTGGAAAAEQTCPPIGSQLDTPTSSPTSTATVPPPTPSPTPTSSPSPTPQPPTASPPPHTPGDCSGPGGGASLPSAPSPTSPPSADAYGATQVLSAGYLGSAADNAIEFAVIPGRPNEGVIATQAGYIYHVMLDGSSEPTLWGDVHSLVTFKNDEQGLLSLAFSPSYTQDCRVYLYYTPGSPFPTVLARFLSTPEGGLDFGSKEVLIQVEEFAANHNGGNIVFDSSGYLYFSVGDGGGAGDPHRRGQALSTLLGKVSRIDVSGQSGYSIPSGNPFAGDGSKCTIPRSANDTSTCPEIYAYGFRNPFRISIDPVSGQLWAGDVGQSAWEEVDLVTNGGNYGWSCREGPVTYNACAVTSFVEPRAYYGHSDGNQAVTGGVIYHGASMPELYGWYVYADFYSGNVWAVNPADSSDAVQITHHGGHNISDFILAANGEVYMLDYYSGLYQLSR